MSEVKTNKISPSSGTTLTLGDSGDTVNVAGTAGTGFGSNTPAFYVYAATNQTPGDNTWAKITVITTETFDTDSAYDTSTQRFTVPTGKAGKYHLSATNTAGSTSVSELYTNKIAFRLNGAATNLVETTNDGRNSAFYRWTSHVDAILDLSVGDYIEVWAFTKLSTGAPTWIHDDAAQGIRFHGYKLIT